MRAWFAALFLVPAAVAAPQTSRPTVPKNLSRADEIRYARSAAPADVSKGATVWVLESGHYVVAEKGTSGMACSVFRERPNSFVPVCGDAEADATVMAISRFQTEERLAGKSRDEIKSEVDQGLTSGRFRVPHSPALTYMTSSAQVITDTSGGRPTRFLPHLMVFYPNMHGEGLGLVESNSMDIPLLDEDGTPMSRLVIVVRDWTQPATPTQ
jgi:hypothetical protein